MPIRGVVDERAKLLTFEVVGDWTTEEMEHTTIEGVRSIAGRDGYDTLCDIRHTGRASTPAEIRQAFRDAAKRAHPDTGGDEGAFRQVVDAFHRLQDPLGERFTAPPARAARATHNPDLARRMDRMVRLEEGRLVEA